MSLAPYIVSGKPFVYEKTLYQPTENEVFEVISFPNKPLKSRGEWLYNVVKRAAQDFKSAEQFDKLAKEHRLCFYIKSKQTLVMEESVMKPLPCRNVTTLCKGNNLF